MREINEFLPPRIPLSLTLSKLCDDDDSLGEYRRWIKRWEQIMPLFSEQKNLLINSNTIVRKEKGAKVTFEMSGTNEVLLYVICWSAVHMKDYELELVRVRSEYVITCMCMLGGHHVNQNGLLTIPGVLGLSAGLWVKLPLWLVETVCDFLLLRPMASIDWLLLRMTRYREKRGDTVSGSTWVLRGNATHWLSKTDWLQYF